MCFRFVSGVSQVCLKCISGDLGVFQMCFMCVLGVSLMCLKCV